MEVMGLMLGEFVDEYTVRVIDVFAMPQSGWFIYLLILDFSNTLFLICFFFVIINTIGSSHSFYFIDNQNHQKWSSGKFVGLEHHKRLKNILGCPIFSFFQVIANIFLSGARDQFLPNICQSCYLVNLVYVFRYRSIRRSSRSSFPGNKQKLSFSSIFFKGPSLFQELHARFTTNLFLNFDK